MNAKANTMEKWRPISYSAITGTVWCFCIRVTESPPHRTPSLLVWLEVRSDSSLLASQPVATPFPMWAGWLCGLLRGEINPHVICANLIFPLLGWLKIMNITLMITHFAPPVFVALQARSLGTSLLLDVSCALWTSIEIYLINCGAIYLNKVFDKQCFTKITRRTLCMKVFSYTVVPFIDTVLTNTVRLIVQKIRFGVPPQNDFVCWKIIWRV